MKLGMRKKYGQNFLITRDTRQGIIDLLEAERDSSAWEIGPGLGAMTDAALNYRMQLSVFEIDAGFADYLESHYGCDTNFKLYRGDFIKTWKNALAESGFPHLVFGNLPFNAAAAMIAVLIEGAVFPKRMVFTMQKEAALRICAKPSTKSYSSFSVLCQSCYHSQIAFDLNPKVFWPAPHVWSSVVIMNLRDDKAECAGNKKFTNFTQSCFSSRRKTLLNNLLIAGHKKEKIIETCTALNISPTIRAEALNPFMFIRLFNSMYSS
jgi:16S rRNA (adenine1518-N6/adenine1519-N6)-dimethyltransferase